MLTGDGATKTISSADGDAAVWGAGGDITADATHVSFNFSAGDGGFLVFQDGMGSGSFYWCLNSTNGGCLQSESVVPQHFDGYERAVCDPERQPDRRDGG